ncbi:hypothetical protein FHS10_000114 [Mucilaginibacter dorajii]|nr:hypothetical protein [Mucilaginibacter dorajii]MCS3732192.1 hypothetical protein [Mucilaginibacter dorajii]
METPDQTELITEDYSIVNEWAADNTFFRIETVFLHHMMDDYIARCLKPEQVKKVKQVKIDLYQLEAHELYIGEVLKQQMKNLAEMSKEGATVIENDIVAKHLQLKKLIHGITLEYRAFRQVLYALLTEKCK